MDIWILVLPLKIIMRIPRPPREKLALFVIFGLGVISTIASIIRLQSLRIFTLSNDPFYDSLPINSKLYTIMFTQNSANVHSSTLSVVYGRG